MTENRKRIAILGSTGSIGRSAIEVVQAIPDAIEVVGLSAHRRLDDLCRQAKELQPHWLVATDAPGGKQFPWPKLPDVEVHLGHEPLNQLVAADDVDLILAAIVGVAGLESTLAAVQAGKTVALANKETLVAAGHLVMELAAASGATILPVDSEHSAIFQAARAGRIEEIRRVLLTASGGPFLNLSLEELDRVSIEQALDHPTWDMGPKITIDSATMMNKALEIIEARWLFNLDPDKIQVVIHPQSIVHSLVEFVDGSVVAQLSPPDMRLPIQYALTYPHRIPGPSLRQSFDQPFALQFQPPDPQRFPALELGLQVARDGGSCGAVLNAANEAAVAAYLAGELAFTDIVPACAAVLNHHTFDPKASLEAILRLDRWAREEINKWICA